MSELLISQDMLQAYRQHIIRDHENFMDRTKCRCPANEDFGIDFKVSSKFIKVIVTNKAGKHQSSHSFIVNHNDGKFPLGTILKAASWNSPAKNFSRGSIFVPSRWGNISWTGAN